jgi:pilus assembly protein Flp/PilA
MFLFETSFYPKDSLTVRYSNPRLPLTKAGLEWRNIMKSLALKVQRFLVSEDGPTAVEYAVMLALIVIVCLAAIGQVGTKANATFETVQAALPG